MTRFFSAQEGTPGDQSINQHSPTSGDVALLGQQDEHSIAGYERLELPDGSVIDIPIDDLGSTYSGPFITSQQEALDLLASLPDDNEFYIELDSSEKLYEYHNQLAASDDLARKLEYFDALYSVYTDCETARSNHPIGSAAYQKWHRHVTKICSMLDDLTGSNQDLEQKLRADGRIRDASPSATLS